MEFFLSCLMIQSERENSVFLNMVSGLIPVCYFPFGSMVKELIFFML